MLYAVGYASKNHVCFIHNLLSCEALCPDDKCIPPTNNRNSTELLYCDRTFLQPPLKIGACSHKILKSKSSGIHRLSMTELQQQLTPRLLFRKAYLTTETLNRLEEEVQSSLSFKDKKETLTKRLVVNLDKYSKRLQDDKSELEQTLIDINTKLMTLLLQQFESALDCKPLNNIEKYTEHLSQEHLDTLLATKREGVEKIIEKVKDISDGKAESNVKSIVHKTLTELDDKLRKKIQDFQLSSCKQVEDITYPTNEILKDKVKWASDNKINDIIVNSIYKKWLGLPTKEDESQLNVSKLAQEAFTHHLGDQLLNLLMHGSLTSRQNLSTTSKNRLHLQAKEIARIRKKHLQRKKIEGSLAKIAKIEQETQEFLSLFDTAFERVKIQQVLKRLAFINDIAENHEAVLKFMNAPLGTYNANHTCKPDSLLSQIPQKINLYKNGALSSSLAASIVQYTTNMNLFADVENRIKDLEKKI
ncbi:hypothetical protein BDF20DRAFT_983957 [Mycotypha africana]|uniref:uncharacterized protein n=1 Tax=Mycotypha africana TaxID=64632 RepID=UPI002300AE22|nr:uncharacterized protein BDF20DRAFT_983957 [Mycotypha africana]KAI8991265.1 hypothetical protein BDF20DRAFT_983957 [Mycotypha africana]